MKPHRSLIALLLALFMGSACKKTPGSIPMLGVNEKGEETLENIDGDKYARKFSTILNSVNDEVGDSITTNTKKSGWRLNALILGLAINYKVGIGVVGLGVTPTMILIFVRNQK